MHIGEAAAVKRAAGKANYLRPRSCTVLAKIMHLQPEQPSGDHLARLIRLYVGLALFGVSTALMVRSGLGLMAWSVLHEGLSRQTGLSIGLVTNLLGALVLLVWIPLRQRPGLGTISNVLVIGTATDLTLMLLPEVGALPTRTAFLLAGIALNGFATAAYISAGYGPGPRDGLTTGLVKVTGLSIQRARLGVELVVLAGGWVLGGTVGVGTVLHALAIGPLMQAGLAIFARKDRKSAGRCAPAGAKARSGGDCPGSTR